VSLEKKPSVYDYLDYRAFLRDLVAYLRARGEYSVRTFAKATKIKSSNYMYMVISGQRNITESTAKKIARGFDLGVNEQEYFLSLVRFTQGRDGNAQAEDLKDLIRLQKKLPRKQLVAKEMEALSQWQVAVLLIALTTEFRELNLTEQAEALGVNEHQLKMWIQTLQQGGLIDADGRPNEVHFQIPDQAQGLVVRGLHKQMLQKAIEAADNVPVSERDLSFLTLSLSPENYIKAREMVAKFRSEMSELFSDNASAKVIYQVNFQIFPVLSWAK
jgi:uncharacterized protein (TIGR02147 family)